MASNTSRIFWISAIITIVVAGFLTYTSQLQKPSNDAVKNGGKGVVPVEVADVQQGPLSLRRTFSGTIEARAQFTVAPKINGRIRSVLVEVSDNVSRGQTVVQLEDAEFRQAVLEAEARLAVAEANRDESVSNLEIAQRELDRIKILFDRGIASESSFDTAQAKYLTSLAAVKVAEANLRREEATLKSARIRLGYASVKAEWKKGDDDRTVAERYIDEGNTVAANTSLLSIVEIDPVLAIIQVTEKDYPLIRLGQVVKVRTDAYPTSTFSGKVIRISPIFRESSRQARMEIEVANPEYLLKPGMFSRCTLELEQVEKALSVPQMAITKRNDQIGVFRLTDDEQAVEWIAVKVGITSGDQVQIIEPSLSGKVITLGQLFIEDGSLVRVAGTYAMTKGGTVSQ